MQKLKLVTIKKVRRMFSSGGTAMRIAVDHPSLTWSEHMSTVVQVVLDSKAEPLEHWLTSAHSTVIPILVGIEV